MVVIIKVNVAGEQGTHNQDQTAGTRTEEVKSAEPVRRYEDFSEVDRIASERKGRFFQAEWFKVLDWIVYDRKKNAIFCESCTNHPTSTSIDVFQLGSGAGMRNWKGSEKLADHAESVDHRVSSRRAREKVFTPVAIQLDAHLAAQYGLRRQGLISHLHTLKTRHSYSW